MSEVIETKQDIVATSAQVPAQVPANSPMGMMMAAVQQGIPLEQVEQMMNLHQRWEEREAEKSFNDAMAGFKAEAVEIIKRREVDFTSQKGRTNYKHAELSDVVQAVGPALSKHGFAWNWKTEQENGLIRVTCILKHRQGHSDSVSLEASADQSGNKNSIQAIASTVTYLQRHTLKAITGVSEKGEDTDGVVDNSQIFGALVKEAAACRTLDDLGNVYAQGIQKIRETNDMDLYERFKQFINTRKEEIAANTDKGAS